MHSSNRDTLTSQTEHGKVIARCQAEHKPVADKLVVEILLAYISKLPPDARVLLTGFPTEIEQIYELQSNGLQISLILHLQADTGLLKKRLLSHGHSE